MVWARGRARDRHRVRVRSMGGVDSDLSIRASIVHPRLCIGIAAVAGSRFGPQRVMESFRARVDVTARGRLGLIKVVIDPSCDRC